MPRKPAPAPRPNRDQLALEILDLLERAGTTGMTLDDLLAAITPNRASRPTIRRALADLRSDRYEAELVYLGTTRRWYLRSRVALPLEAPDREDLLAVLIARAILEPFVDESLLDRITKLIENLDERARTRTSPRNLPTRKSMTSTLTLGTRVDPIIFRRLLTACRRNAILIRHTSPWQTPVEDVKLQQIEPWSLRVHDGAVYLRAWSTSLQDVRNYRVADIEAVEDLEGPPCAPRHQPPADPWADENPAFGIDYDRPNTAVIRLRGGVARWVARVIWHPGEQDEWLEKGELLERTVAYRSCREMARRLASLLDGIESIEPQELRDEVVALVAHVVRLKQRTKAARPSRAPRTPARSGRAS